MIRRTVAVVVSVVIVVFVAGCKTNGQSSEHPGGAEHPRSSEHPK